jgi:hypothetical protein
MVLALPSQFPAAQPCHGTSRRSHDVDSSRFECVMPGFVEGRSQGTIFPTLLRRSRRRQNGVDEYKMGCRSEHVHYPCGFLARVLDAFGQLGQNVIDGLFGLCSVLSFSRRARSLERRLLSMNDRSQHTLHYHFAPP